MITDILHSHVGDLNIWSNTDLFFFFSFLPNVLTSHKWPVFPGNTFSPFHPFYWVETFGTFFFFFFFEKEDIYSVRLSHLLNSCLTKCEGFSGSCKHDAKCLMCTHVALGYQYGTGSMCEMKRGMRSLHHRLPVTFSQSVSRLVAFFFLLFFCRTMI